MSLADRIFAATYDRVTGKVEKAGLAQQRRTLLAAAAGDVLEIGAGTGANLPYYCEAVVSLTVTEPEAPMLRRLQKRTHTLFPRATVLRAPAEDLPFEDDTFDVVVATLVLCTVEDQPRALRGGRRVLKPGGRLLFLEHIRAEGPKLSRLQDRMNGLNRVVAHGCNCNRPTLESIRRAGFEVAQLDHGSLPKAPAFIRPLIVGVATNPTRTKVPSEPAAALHT
jgi:ubiquinone/menaquinone biosynthesis C-methylase UbiE